MRLFPHRTWLLAPLAALCLLAPSFATPVLADPPAGCGGGGSVLGGTFFVTASCQSSQRTVTGANLSSGSTSYWNAPSLPPLACLSGPPSRPANCTGMNGEYCDSRTVGNPGSAGFIDQNHYDYIRVVHANATTYTLASTSAPGPLAGQANQAEVNAIHSGAALAVESTGDAGGDPSIDNRIQIYITGGYVYYIWQQRGDTWAGGAVSTPNRSWVNTGYSRAPYFGYSPSSSSAASGGWGGASNPPSYSTTTPIAFTLSRLFYPTVTYGAGNTYPDSYSTTFNVSTWYVNLGYASNGDQLRSYHYSSTYTRSDTFYLSTGYVFGVWLNAALGRVTTTSIFSSTTAQEYEISSWNPISSPTCQNNGSWTLATNSPTGENAWASPDFYVFQTAWRISAPGVIRTSPWISQAAAEASIGPGSFSQTTQNDPRLQVLDTSYPYIISGLTLKTDACPGGCPWNGATKIVAQATAWSQPDANGVSYLVSYYAVAGLMGTKWDFGDPSMTATSAGDGAINLLSLGGAHTPAKIGSFYARAYEYYGIGIFQVYWDTTQQRVVVQQINTAATSGYDGSKCPTDLRSWERPAGSNFCIAAPANPTLPNGQPSNGIPDKLVGGVATGGLPYSVGQIQSVPGN